MLVHLYTQGSYSGTSVRQIAKLQLRISIYAGFDRVALEFLSLLRTFENPTKFIKISFEPDSSSEQLKGDRSMPVFQAEGVMRCGHSLTP